MIKTRQRKKAQTNNAKKIDIMVIVLDLFLHPALPHENSSSILK